MSRQRTGLIVLPLLATLASALSCQALPSQATPGPAATSTPPPSQPTETPPAASTSTLAVPTETPLPTATLFDFAGQFNGTPLPSWHGIPVMPGALIGGENSGLYGFSTNASPEEVAAYYSAQIPPLGYRPGPGNGTPSSGVTMLVFYGSPGHAAMVNIMTVRGVTIVMLGSQ